MYRPIADRDPRTFTFQTRIRQGTVFIDLRGMYVDPMSAVHVSGQLVCENAEEAAAVLANLAEHILLIRAEPGCRFFDVNATSDPLVWEVGERFETEQHSGHTKNELQAATGVGTPPEPNDDTQYRACVTNRSLRSCRDPKEFAGGRGSVFASPVSFVASRYRVHVEQGVFDRVADRGHIAWDDLRPVTRWMPLLQKPADKVQAGCDPR